MSEPVCKTCDDTHLMWMTSLERDVACTRCPRPCARCARGAFCATTPCACACHKPAAARAEAKHTPGPWKVVIDIAGARVVADGIGFTAPYRLPPGSGEDPQQTADTHLIAAAPDLLAALENAERKLTAYVGVCSGDKELTGAILPQARAAIADAKGGAR